MNRDLLTPYLWMLVGALAFAAMGTCAYALQGVCRWVVIALARATVPLFFSAAMLALRHERAVFLRPGTLWIRSLAGSLSLVCTFFAFTRLPVSDVLTLTNLFPVWVAILAWPLLNQRPDTEVWLAVASGVLGVVLIQQPHMAEGNFAAMVALFSSFTSAVALLGLHRLHGISTWAIVLHFSFVSLVICTGALFWLGEAHALWQLAPRSLLLLLGVGLTATLGQLCLTKAFTTGAPSRVSVVGLSQVGFAMVFDALLWGRTFGATTIGGMACIVAPTAWLMLKQGMRSPPPAGDALPIETAIPFDASE